MLHPLLTDSRVSRFIEHQVDGSFYYNPAWLNLITSLYDYSLKLLTTADSTGRITGFLPLCLMQSPLTGRRLVSLPFSDLCPLLAEDESSASELIDKAIQLAQREKVRYLELRTGTNEVLARRTDLVEANLYVRWLMSLTPDPDVIWSHLRKPVQHQVKKSQKLGVRFRIAQNRADVAQYYRLHLQTRCKKHGMPAQPQRYFLELWDSFSGNGGMHLLLAEYQETIIAGMILLTSGTTMRYAYGASDEQYLHLAPNNLLMWNAITLGCTLGCSTFDLGRTASDNEGLMEFKRRWGAVKEPLPYYYYPGTSGLAATSETSWKFRLLTSCWRRLPLSVAASLGNRLYKHLG